MAKRTCHHEDIYCNFSQVLQSKELVQIIAGYQNGIFYEFVPINNLMQPYRRTLRGCMPTRIEDRSLEDIVKMHGILSTWYKDHNLPIDLIKMLNCMEYMRSFVAHHVVYEGLHGLAADLHKAFDLATFSGNLIDIAAERGHLSILKCLHTHHHPGCTTNAMDDSAAHGYLDIVRFLHSNRTEGCTTDAMDSAAANGHFDVVSFLHIHRQEGCTASAIDSAAANGHLAIVEFLHFHRAEGCSTYAIDGAAANGHFNVVQFLCENRYEGCTPRALMLAARRGDIDIVKMLYTHMITTLSYSDMKAILAMSRNPAVLDFFSQVTVLPLSDEDVSSDY